MREISNQELRLADIPGDDAPDFELQEFALTFNGYAEFPDDSGRDSCAVIANSKDHRSLSRVRACLFFEQRRGRQSDIGWDRAEALTLLELIRKFVHEKRYRLPGVRGKNGASTADLVQEISSLCEANIATIRRISQFNAEREIRDEINRRLRAVHNVLGMAAGSRRFGCLYIEKNLDEAEPFIAEHAIPVSALVKLFERGMPFVDLAFFPVSLISKISDRRLAEAKLTKSGHDESFKEVFRRYAIAGVALETHDGKPVDAETWTMDDHLSLIRRTPALNEVYDAVFRRIASN